jgi:hypothetical protein
MATVKVTLSRDVVVSARIVALDTLARSDENDAGGWHTVPGHHYYYRLSLCLFISLKHKEYPAPRW